MQYTILVLISFMIFSYLWYYLFKIGKFYYKAIAEYEKRPYRGFRKEYRNGGMKQLLGILPLPYLLEDPPFSKNNEYLIGRRKNVVNFYLTVLFLFVYHLILSFAGLLW